MKNTLIRATCISFINKRRNTDLIRTFFLLMIIAHFFQTADAQIKNKLFKNNAYQLGIGAFFSSDSTLPFWLRANKYGEVPLKSNFIQFSAQVKHEYDSTFNRDGRLKRYDWGYGARSVINTGKVNQLILTEAYLKTRFGPFEFYGGRRKEIFGIVDTTLTSGSYIWSGNSLPMPKLQISIPNYTPILKNGLISLKGGFAHGWFDNDRLYTSKLKLHQKWLYFRFGKPSWRLNFYAGGNHQAQWGGFSPFYTVDGKLPDGFKNYIHVVLGTRGAIAGVKETLDFDANRIGNHLGSVDVAMQINNSNYDILLYRQSFYDDGSLFYLNNINDGLNGLSIKFKQPLYNKIQIKLNFEYLKTSDQGGNTFLLFANDKSEVPDELRGSDRYFNNSQIRDGWVYRNSVIGTPFIQVPNKNDFTSVNRVEQFSTSISLKSSKLSFVYRYTSLLSLPDFGLENFNLKKNRFQNLISKYQFNSQVSLNVSACFEKSLYMSNIIWGGFIGIQFNPI